MHKYRLLGKKGEGTFSEARNGRVPRRPVAEGRKAGTGARPQTTEGRGDLGERQPMLGPSSLCWAMCWLLTVRNGSRWLPVVRPPNARKREARMTGSRASGPGSC
jgi:hypothetical protein